VRAVDRCLEDVNRGELVNGQRLCARLCCQQNRLDRDMKCQILNEVLVSSSSSNSSSSRSGSCSGSGSGWRLIQLQISRGQKGMHPQMAIGQKIAY